MNKLLPTKCINILEITNFIYNIVIIKLNKFKLNFTEDNIIIKKIFFYQKLIYY